VEQHCAAWVVGVADEGCFAGYYKGIKKKQSSIAGSGGRRDSSRGEIVAVASPPCRLGAAISVPKASFPSLLAGPGKLEHPGLLHLHSIL